MGKVGRGITKVGVEGWGLGCSGVCPWLARGNSPKPSPKRKSRWLPHRGKAEPLKSKRISLQPGLCPVEAAVRVTYNRGRIRSALGWPREPIDPSSSPALGAPASPRRPWLSPPGALQAPTPLPRQVGGCRLQSFCRKVRPRTPHGPSLLPGSGGTSALPLLQGGTDAPRPFLFISPLHQPSTWTPEPPPPRGPIRLASFPGQRANAYLGGRHASPRCGRQRDPLTRALALRDRRLTSRPAAVAEAAIRLGSVRARPASPRPPASAGQAGAARPLAGPGPGRRGARDPAGLCPAAGAGQGPREVNRTRTRDPGRAVPQRRPRRLGLRGGRGASLLPGGRWPRQDSRALEIHRRSHSLGKLRTPPAHMFSQLFLVGSLSKRLHSALSYKWIQKHWLVEGKTAKSGRWQCYF